MKKEDKKEEEFKAEMLPATTTSVVVFVLTQMVKAVISFFTLRWLTYMFNKKRE